MKTVLVFFTALLVFATYVSADEPEDETSTVEEGAGTEEVSSEPSPAYAKYPAAAGEETSPVGAAAHPLGAAAVTPPTDIKRAIMRVPPEAVPKPDKAPTGHKAREPESEEKSAEETATDLEEGSSASGGR